MKRPTRIAAFLGRHMSPTDAAALGAFVHGLAGDIAASKKGRTGMVAGDVMDALPAAFLEIESTGGR